MGIFKKIFKGIKKFVKNVGKGIKKVAKKVGKVFNKAGIVGQLGMMFLMPYAMSGLSSLWGSFGQFAAGQTGALGKAFQAIHSAGSAVGNVYTTVSEAISNGLDRAGNFLQGEGFGLSEGKTSIFAPKGDTVSRNVAGKAVDVSANKAAESYYDKAIKDVTVFDDKGLRILDIKPPVEDVVAKKSLLDKGIDFVTEAAGSIVEDLTDPVQLANSASRGVYGGVSQRVAAEIAGDPPVQRYLNVSPFDIQIAQSPDVFSTMDFTRVNDTYSLMGSSFKGVSDIYADAFREANISGDASFNKLLKQYRFGS